MRTTSTKNDADLQQTATNATPNNMPIMNNDGRRQTAVGGLQYCCMLTLSANRGELDVMFLPTHELLSPGPIMYWSNDRSWHQTPPLYDVVREQAERYPPPSVPNTRHVHSSVRSPIPTRHRTPALHSGGTSRTPTRRTTSWRRKAPHLRPRRQHPRLLRASANPSPLAPPSTAPSLFRLGPRLPAILVHLPFWYNGSP